MLLPMLLTDAGRTFDDPAWLWEVKWDGIRCVVVKEGGTVRLYSRHQLEMTKAFPEVRRDLENALSGVDGIFDGELVCTAPDGRADFYSVMARHGVENQRKIEHAARVNPATLMLFDVIEQAGRRVTGRRLTERKAILSQLVAPAGAVQLVESFEGTRGTALLQAVAARDVEGIVGKRLNSLYRPDHRSSDWVKVKAWKEREVTILGVRRDPFGVLVGEPDGHVLCVIELGWTPADRRALVRLLPDLRQCNKGDVTWVKPLLRARMRYRVTPSGQLREPVWGGFVLAAA